MARSQRPLSPSAAPEPSHHRAVVTSHPEHGAHPVRVCHHQLARLGEAHRASRVFTQLARAHWPQGHIRLGRAIIAHWPRLPPPPPPHLWLRGVGEPLVCSQPARVQRRRINQTAPAPRVCYTVCSYRPTLASAQASASLRERMDAVSASAAATGAVATAAAELVALWRGAVVSPAAGVSTVPPSHQVHTLAQPQLGPREVQAPPYHGGRCGLRAFVRNGVTGHRLCQRMSSPPPLSTQDRTRLRASGCFPIELVPPPPANVGRGAAKLLDLVRPLSDCIEKRLVGWFAIARTGRTRYVAHRVWTAAGRGSARRC